MQRLLMTERGQRLYDEVFGDWEFTLFKDRGKVRYFIEFNLMTRGEPRTRWLCERLLEGVPHERAAAPLEGWLSPEEIERLEKRPSSFSLRRGADGAP